MADLQSSLASPTNTAAKSSIWIYVVVAAAIGGGIFFWQHPPSAGGKGHDETVEKSAFPLDTFIVNLEGGGQRAYLRAGITLGLSHPLSRNQTEVDIPMVRDAILSVLATAKADQLLTAEGKDQLKADILRSVTEHAPQLGVEHVYFTEFLVQM